MTNKPQHWKRTDSQRVADYGIFRVRKDTSISPRTGRALGFVVLECPDWVNVIPVTPEGEVVFIHQYRHGIEGMTLEIPGGAVDGRDTHPCEAARRELREETGYDAEEYVYLGYTTPNPAFQNNRCHAVLARNARPATEPKFDPGEDIANELIPLDQVREYIHTGQITHALVVAAFYLYESWLKQGAPPRET